MFLLYLFEIETYQCNTSAVVSAACMRHLKSKVYLQ